MHDLLNADELQPLVDDAEHQPLKVDPSAAAQSWCPTDIKCEAIPEQWATISGLHSPDRTVQVRPKPKLIADPALLATRRKLLATPTYSPRTKRRISEAQIITMDELDEASNDEEAESNGDEGDDEADSDPLFLSDVPEFSMSTLSDEEVAALVPSPSILTGLNCSSLPEDGIPPALPSPTVSADDIPDVVSLFNSLYSPAVHRTGVVPSPFASVLPSPSPLRISVPPTNVFNGSPALPIAPTPTAPMPNYFTPPSLPVGPQQVLNPFLTADTLSPALKASLIQNQMSAAALAMANSAAALNTIRKLNTTYGVPIAPLQCAMSSNGELPLKPKLSVVASVNSAINAVNASTTKGGKLAITPDIADFKLVQIFHQFCDPSSKLLTLPTFHQLLQHHQSRDESANATSNATPNANGNGAVSQDALHLFKLMDPNNSGFVDLERFMSSFQICNRCTEAKRRAHSALCAQQGQSFVPTALERQLMEDVAPVIVRVVPTAFEGSKVRSCEHYQWTWCEGFSKTGNEKCRGTNRHDKCPKYLANCTLWKHKLPPKNRKPKLVEVLDSPSKKLKHFG